MISIAILPLALCALARAPVHPDSMSSSELVVDGAQARLLVRCQMLSLLEVLPQLDADGDGSVVDADVDRHADAIAEYVGEHYLLRTGTDREHAGGAALELSPDSVEPWKNHDLAPRLRDWVEVRFHATSPVPIRDVLVESSLFLVTSPQHMDITTVRWVASGASGVLVLDAAHPRERFDPEGRGAFGVFVKLGWGHILGGWDHLAFVLVLVLGSRRLRSLVSVVTAFTVAHSITLACASLGWIDLSQHAHLIEAAIALSIAYVAADNLMREDRRRSHAREAFVFGLIHGLGFAGFLRESLVNEQARGMALFAFNVGVEAGQLAVVIVLALALRLVRGKQPPGEYLAPKPVRRVGSAAVVVVGLVAFFQRL
jgi:hypothetical protein